MLKTNSIKEELKQPTNPKEVTPLSVWDFLQYHRARGLDLLPKKGHVEALIRRLVSSQVLVSFGGASQGERIGGNVVVQDHVVSHQQIDVGVIFLKEPIAPQLPDLAFRDAAILEEVVIAGYPSVPRSKAPALTFQLGEINGHIPDTLDAYPMDLFSAIARPGNSGGPVVATDGRVVGIVTRSLEREKEEADPMAPLPFFAAVPSKIIAKALADLDSSGTSLAWEDWS